MTEIRRVAVLGAGVMGSQIAAHCANAGLEVLLFDAGPEQLGEVAVFLCTDAAAQVRGAAWTVDGGWCAQ